MPVYLSKAHQQQIFDLMVAGYPNESGGFLLGQLQADATTVQDVVSITNVFAVEEQYHRYAMTPQDWMRLEDYADDRGLTLLGYFHSHPDSPAVPSAFDRDHALPNFVYIITQVQQGAAVEQRVWRLRVDRSQFDEEELIVTD
jgi:proteasome lid subunit RPN8/RPN11